MTAPENHEEDLNPEEEVVAAVVVEEEVLCHGFETAWARIDEMNRIPFVNFISSQF